LGREADEESREEVVEIGWGVFFGKVKVGCVS
jgi:hypothetical protein